LFEAAVEMVTLAPLAVSVAVWFELCPTVTLPKFAVAGATLSCPWLEPEPESAMLRFELPAVKDRLPDTEAAD